MIRDFGYKLRLTAALLGCASQKDLCARFRAVNPGTAFELERSYKWMQGRALPRSSQVYEDWAALLGTNEPVTNLQSCSIETFLDVICAHHDVGREALVDGAVALARSRPMVSGAAKPVGTLDHLIGAYACYSHAWSPYFEDRIIRDSLVVDVTSGSGPIATYGERIALGPPMCLFMPRKLASVLTGVMVGMTIVDADPQPCATRIAMIRMPGVDVPRLKSSNRYIDLANESLSSDLALRLQAAEFSALDALLAEFLEGDRARAHLHVGSDEHAKLTHALDRLLLQSARTSQVLA